MKKCPHGNIFKSGQTPARGQRGSRGIPREAVVGPYRHHPDDCGRGSRERQGGDGGFGDVVGVSSIYFGTDHAESDWNRPVRSRMQGGVGPGS